MVKSDQRAKNRHEGQGNGHRHVTKGAVKSMVYVDDNEPTVL